MTDRELLDAAAKAILFGDCDGRTIWTESEYPRGSGCNGALWNGRGYMDTAELWNPLTDDGDALRLAVVRRVDVLHFGDATVQARAGDGPIATEYVNIGEDHAEATRRAIVRAAAALAVG